MQKQNFEKYAFFELGPAATIRYLTLEKIEDWFRGITNDPRNPNDTQVLHWIEKRSIYDRFAIV